MNIQLRYYDVLESTNITAVEAALVGAEEGTVIVAKRQNKASGRLSRPWNSPDGGLWFSIILRPKIDPAYVAQLTLLSGVAVAKAVQKIYGSKCVAKIKWPNDLLIDGKKFCGILSEMSLDETENVDYAILGIGVNVNLQENDFSEDLKKIATSLILQSNEYHSCDEILKIILEELSLEYERWLDNGPEELFSEWKLNSCTIGKHVQIKDDDKVIFEGIAIDMNSQGALIVRDKSGVQRSFDFGEISIR